MGTEVLTLVEHFLEHGYKFSTSKFRSRSEMHHLELDRARENRLDRRGGHVQAVERNMGQQVAHIEIPSVGGLESSQRVNHRVVARLEAGGVPGSKFPRDLGHDL